MPSYSYRYQPFKVYFDGAFQEHVHCKAIRRSAGNQRADAVELEVSLDTQKLRAAGVLGFTGNPLPTVEVTTALGRVLFAGKLTQIPLVLDQSSEHIEYIARLEPFCLGDPVGFLPHYWTRQPNYALMQVHRPLVFNPVSDARVRPNRDFAPLTGHEGGICGFLEYDSTRTPRAIGVWDGQPVEWSLADIVLYLCWVLNPVQEFAFNPTFGELEQVFGERETTTDRVRNFIVKHGDYLGDVLDDLLNPRGYQWFLDHQGLGVRTLRFYQRGIGRGLPLHVYMEQAGNILDPARDNCCAAHLTYDQGALANRVRIRGARRQYELTLELHRGWAPEHDDIPKSDPELLAAENPNAVQYRDVWRKWVLNEAGDYTGLRPEIATHFDLGALLGSPSSEFWIPRRRRFLPCITRGTDFKPIGPRFGVTLEYFDTVENRWQVCADDMPFHLSQDECAVEFTGTMPPDQLLAAGENARVRITATLESDMPIVSLVAQSNASPTSDRLPLAVDMDDYFHYREVTPHSQYHSAVRAGFLVADEVDDTPMMQLHAAKLLDAWDYGQIRGTLVLEGVDRFDVELGRPVTGLRGRNFDFNGRVGATAAPRYPVIVAVTYECRQQKTYLTIEQFRKHSMPEVG